MKKLLLSITFLIWTSCVVMAQLTSTKPMNVAIFLYEGVELLDFAGPYEVFGNTGGFNVYTVSYLPEVSVFPQNKIKLKPDYQLIDCPKPDIIIFPGATLASVMKVYTNQEVMAWINATNKKTQLTMSVCTGAYFLAKIGALDGRSVTTHHGAIDYLQKQTPQAKVLKNTRYVEDGKILTTAGVSAGLDGALHIVAKLKGLEVAKSVASLMEYDHWKPNLGIVINPKTAVNQTENQLKKSGQTKNLKTQTVIRDFLAEETDPVCNMHINKNTKHLTEHKGTKIGFCSTSCKATFDKNPNKYLTAKP